VKATLLRPRFVCGATRFTRLRLFGRSFALALDCSVYQG
jgi:hypothetical protein